MGVAYSASPITTHIVYVCRTATLAKALHFLFYYILQAHGGTVEFSCRLRISAERVARVTVVAAIRGALCRLYFSFWRVVSVLLGDWITESSPVLHIVIVRTARSFS